MAFAAARAVAYPRAWVDVTEAVVTASAATCFAVYLQPSRTTLLLVSVSVLSEQMAGRNGIFE